MVLFSRSFVRKRVISLATRASVAAISFALAEDPARTDRSRGATPIQYLVDRSDHSEQPPLPSENDAATNKIMVDMTVNQAGDVDRDFAAMMVPNHQGAVGMAKAELKYGHNERLRRLAQEIVAKQQRELTGMRNAVDEGRPSAAPSPAQPRAQLSPQSFPIDRPVAHGAMKMSRSPAPVTWLFSQPALRG
jgi:hypothetical protein